MIRPATHRDAFAIAALDNPEGRHPSRQERETWERLSFCEDISLYVSPEDPNEIQGVALSRYGYSPVGNSVTLRRLFVRPSKKGQGIGSILLAHVLSTADDQKLPTLLTVRSDNIDAIKLYKRFGFAVYDQEDRLGLLRMIKPFRRSDESHEDAAKAGL